jgi:hypothetical protein
MIDTTGGTAVGNNGFGAGKLRFVNGKVKIIRPWW